MQKKIFSMLVLLMTAVSGAWAQYDSHWPDFNGQDYGYSNPIVAAIQIDGVTITSEYEGWDALEIAFFVGDECRGNGNYLYNGYVEEYSDPFPVLDGAPLYCTTENEGETVSVKMYDHINGVLYDDCTVIYDGNPLTIYTGEDHDEGWFDPEYPVFLSFTTPEPAPAAPEVTPTANKNEWTFTMPNYAVVVNVEYDTELALNEATDNTAALDEWDDYEANVTLTRTLQTGGWNTLALPFSMTLAEFKTAIGDDQVEVKELISSELNGETLTLNFDDAQSIVAGTPYLVKISLENNVDLNTVPFNGVIISETTQPTVTTYANFVPVFSPTNLEGGNTNILFVTDGNTLTYPENSGDINGFRAYFLLHDAPTARAFAMSFGDATDITTVLPDEPTKASGTYDLQGRRIEGQPTQKGVYIVNGKKTIK